MVIKIDSSNKDTIVIPIYKDKEKIMFFNNKIEQTLQNHILDKIKLFNFNAKENTTLSIEISKQKIILISIKKDYTLENLRIAYSTIFKILQTNREKNCSVIIPKETEEEIIAIIESLNLANYKFDKYVKKEEGLVTQELYLNIEKKFESILKQTLLITNNVKITRDLVNENSNIITPKYFEKISKELAKKHKLKLKILNEKQIQKEGLNLLNAVGTGSQFPPRLIIVEYNGDKTSKQKIAIVGKAITFDTGGTNLKPSGFLEDMKCDMAGGACAYSIFKTAIELNLKKNLLLVIPAAENSLSHNSYKPGDVYIGYSKISVEIANTDAEGRLILADAIGYVQKNYKPTTIIDLATLTGACLVALGENLIALYSNDQKLKDEIFKSGEKTSERVWELPIYDEHRELNKSKIADIKNTGGKFAGSITAAAFIEKFIEKDIIWAHLDIAGAAYARKEVNSYTPEFATGKGVRLIIDYLKNN